MKKYIIHIMMLACVACLWCACQNEEWQGTDTDEGSVTLALQTKAPNGTEAGEEAYNENLIKKVDVYFYADVNQAYAFAQKGITVGTDGKLKVKITPDMYDKTYTIYVIANGPTNYSTAGETLAALQQKTITTAWKDGLTGTNNLTEETLLMDGKGENITITKGGTATIELKRAMAKVVLTPEVEQIITIDGVTYQSDLKAMNVTLVNAVKTTQLDGKYAVNAATDYITRLKRPCTESGHVPFYSYPNPDNTANRKESYLILCVPWKATTGGETTFEDYYYYVPITGGVTTFKPNCYYKVKVQVGMLGSLNPNEPVKLEDVDFEVVNWYDMTLDAEMSQYQYLVLDDYTTELFNQESVTMPFISSSGLVSSETKIVSVEYTNYEKDDFEPGTVSDLSSYKVEVNGSNLKFTHPITEDMYSPYTITIEVCNDQGLKRIWKIVQYPSIYSQK